MRSNKKQGVTQRTRLVNKTTAALLKAVICVSSLAVVSQPAARADTLADWTFDGPPTSSGLLINSTGTAGTGAGSTTFTGAMFPVSGGIAANSGVNASTSLALGSHATATTVWSTPAGNGSSKSFSANMWSVNDYYQFATSTTGYDTISVQFDQISSTTGPAFFQFEYSTDGSTFTPVGSQYTALANTGANTWSSSTGNSATKYTFSGLSALSNQGTVYFRLVDNSTTAAGTGGAPTGTVATAGTDRVDNFIISGLQAGSSQYWDPNGATGNGGNGTWDTTSNLFNTAVDASGSVAAYNNVHPAIFNGTPGTVHLASGGITANGGVRFDVDGYTVQDNTLTLGATNHTIIVTNAGQTATVNSQISGSNGFTKDGNGALVLGSASNNFTGGITLTAGVLSISSDANLGDAGNSIAFGGGTLQDTAPGNLLLAATRNLPGSGVIDVASGNTLTVQGNTNAALRLVNGGTVALAGTSRELTTGLNFDANSAGAVITSSGAPIVLGNNSGANIFANNTSGTVKLDADFQTTSVLASEHNRTVTVSNANGTFEITGKITSSAQITKSGPGTLQLDGDNSIWTGAGAHLIVGSAGTSPADGGTVKIAQATSMGTPDAPGDGTLFFNNGKLLAMNTLTGANAIPVGLSIGGGQSGGASDLDGADMEFLGAVDLFNTAGPSQVSTGGSATPSFNHKLTVKNTTTFDGAISSPAGTGTTPYTFTINGGGKLILNNASNPINVPIIVTGTGTKLVVNGALTDPAATITVQNGAMLSGHGTLQGVALTASGTLAPGDPQSIDLASLSIDSTSFLDIALDPANTVGDMVVTTGDVNLDSDAGAGAALNLSLLSAPTHAESFTIIEDGSADALLGEFAQGSTVTAIFAGNPYVFSIDYAANIDGGSVVNDVVLTFTPTSAPEPASFVLLALGGLLIAGRRRR